MQSYSTGACMHIDSCCFLDYVQGEPVQCMCWDFFRRILFSACAGPANCMCHVQSKLQRLLVIAHPSEGAAQRPTRSYISLTAAWSCHWAVLCLSMVYRRMQAQDAACMLQLRAARQ